MTLIQSQQPKSQVRFTQLSAHLVAATLLFGGMQTAWGQDAGESRWSTSNPPTPAMVHMPQKPQDNGLRRLPPIDQEGTSSAKPAAATPSEKPAAEADIAAKPQSSPMPAQKADPVNWSSPNIVIGPETSTRTVSHEEVVTTPKPERSPSRYSSSLQMPPRSSEGKGTSRFTKTSTAKPQPTVEPATEKPTAAVFARVFDEDVESPGITQPEVASIDTGLSPIFACRLLGLRATKSETTTVQ